jgi:hypothetical protein
MQTHPKTRPKARDGNKQLRSALRRAPRRRAGATAVATALLVLALGAAPAAARPSVLPGMVLPGLTAAAPWANRGPVAAVAEAVKAYPAIFRTARERLMLKEPGSEADLSRANGLFSINVHDICPVIT